MAGIGDGEKREGREKVVKGCSLLPEASRWCRVVIKEFAGCRGRYWRGLRATQMCLGAVSIMNCGGSRLTIGVIHVMVRVDFGARDFLLDLFEQWPDVLIRIPAVCAREWPQAEGLQSIRQTQIVPPPNLLLMRIRRPAVQRRSYYPLLNVDEALLLQHLAGIVLVRNRSVGSPCSVSEISVPR